jgi:hypothetical protein
MKIIDVYKAKSLIETFGTIKAAKELNISPGTLIKKMRDTKTSYVCKTHLPKFDFNYFEKIDTEDKAYWLGFMFADGFVSIINNIRYSVSIELQNKDKVHLEKFKKSLKSKKSLYYTTSKNTWKIMLFSKKMLNDLIGHGCTERKSLTLEWPKTVPNQLIKHFIRGYFDGDGCLITKKSRIDFTGTKVFLDKISFHFTNIGINYKNPYIGNNGVTSRLVYGSENDILNILDYLYKDATIYLDRKFNLYKKLGKV